MTPVEAIHHELMSARDKLQVIHVIELLGDVLSECISGSTR
jgi:hypothetical protein